MNYQKVIDKTLQLQAKIVKACGRNYGSLKSFNSKYKLCYIDWNTNIVYFEHLVYSTEDLVYNFKLIRTEGKRINHTVEVTLIK